MDEQQQKDIDEAAVVDMPTDTPSWITFILREREKVLQHLALRSMRAKQIPDLTVEPLKSIYQRLGVLLKRLDEHVQMTPELKKETRIDEGLNLMFDPRFHFPRADAEKAKKLLERWESERWGANEVLEDGEAKCGEIEVKNEDEVKEPERKRRRKSTATRTEDDEDTSDYGKVLLPPREHPIFGVDGIMHGIALKKGRRKTPVLDPRFPQRNAKVYGHNGLQVGACFPFQIVALSRGAHGVSQGGISGNKETGAYSIVVSGQYDDLDQDSGDILYYSGSNSHDNEDPRGPPPSTQGTLALQASLASENPVRVLRSSSCKSIYAPKDGFRYDGLYKVVSTRYPTNMKGGKYEQFKLVRLEGQPPIDMSRPTPQERRDYVRIKTGFA